MVTQLVINSLFLGSIYCLVALGLSLMFSQTKFFNFAHGGIVAVAPYGAFALMQYCRVGWFLSILAGMALAITLGSFLEACVFRPLRARCDSTFVLLIASLGILVCILNLVSLGFGDVARSIRNAEFDGVVSFGVGRITRIQTISIFVSVFGLASLLVIERGSAIGRAFRAIADDRELARVAGVHVDRITLVAFAIASGLGAAAGILLALDIDMRPQMGMNMLMLGMTAFILGGPGHIVRVALGAYLLALLQQLVVWQVSFQWQDVVVYVALIAALTVVPRSLLLPWFGKRFV